MYSGAIFHLKSYTLELSGKIYECIRIFNLRLKLSMWRIFLKNIHHEMRYKHRIKLVESAFSNKEQNTRDICRVVPKRIIPRTI